MFTNLKVVTNDHLPVKDILYILKSKELKISIKDQFDYFQIAKYPEFGSRCVDEY